MEAIERDILPDSVQITEGASVDPAVHGFHGAINTSFPVRFRELVTNEASYLYTDY